MKKNFLLLCGLLLSVCGFVACSDDETPAGPAPTFPELVTKTAQAGEVIDIEFSANYDWTATISEETYTYFQLLDGETTVNTLSGEAGDQVIKVQVADEVIFENAPVAQVTLAMNGKSQVIAEISYPVAEREVAVYAPMLNEFSGAFKSAGYDATLLYAYNETAMTSEDAVAMQWGVERKNYEDDNTFYAPVKINSNFAYTLAGPAWMAAAQAGVVGEAEVIIKADVTKIPAESESANVDILAGEVKVASFKVSVTGAKDFAPQSTIMPEAAYAFDGEAIDEVSGELIAGNFVKVVCDAEGAAAEWLTVTETAEESEAVIKSYEVSATAAQNEGAARTAYVFYFAANNVPADNAQLFEEGEVKEEYESNLAVTVNQYSEPATIEAVSVDETCATFAQVGKDFTNTWFFDDIENKGIFIGSKYDLYYWGEWAIYGHENTALQASRPIESLTCYYYNDMGSLVEVEDEWVRATTYDAEKVKFKVYCESLDAIPASAKNFENGDGEAVILVKHTDGSYSAIYFHIGAGTAAGDGGVAFVSDFAGQVGAELEELQAGNELYDRYFAEYSSANFPAKIYMLTYEWPMEQNMLPMVELSGLGAYTAMPESDWVSFDSEKQVVIMENAGAGAENPGVLLFKDENRINQVIILCTLLNAGE